MRPFPPRTKPDLPEKGDPLILADGTVATIDSIAAIIWPVNTPAPTQIYVVTEWGGEYVAVATEVPHSWRAERRVPVIR